MARKKGKKNGGGDDNADHDSNTLSYFGRQVLDYARTHTNNYNAETSASGSIHYQTHKPSDTPSNYTGYDPQAYAAYQRQAYYGASSSQTVGQQEMGYNYNQYANGAYGAGYANGAPPGYSAQYTQQQQAYQASPPQITNPFPRPAPAVTYSGNAQYDPDYEQQLAQWNAQYAPADQQPYGKKSATTNATGYGASAQQGTGATAIPGADSKGNSAQDDGVTVVRKGGGETWEDKSLLEWDPKQFRIMVGNLAGEVTDDSLAKAFAPYGVSKARVVRDKRTTKSKGYGFVAFTDHDQGFKAAREMVGKYIGSHPVTIQRSKTNVQPVVHKNQNNKNKGKNNKNKNKDKSEKDPLRANTHAGIEKKAPNKAPPGLKLLG